ncbi:MAG: GNAT family protein [Bryobacteraceae bacterium]|nr:GNAT family protein [Bryobacteraceae bacterium]
MHKGPPPERVTIEGRYATITPLSAGHTGALFACTGRPEHDDLWRYLPHGPYPDLAAYASHIAELERSADPMYFAILRDGQAVGRCALMRIVPEHRVIEVGGILYSPQLQRTAAATEAMYLLAKYVFETLGYRRYEWKCHSLNEPSRRAALRLGFTFEGVFRQHMIFKGANRDTAWFSMLDSEWPARKAAFERWLAPSNFDESGRQKETLR